MRILILEDNKADAELAVRELRRADLEFESRIAETKDQFLNGLEEFAPDLILSDYSLPQFTGLDALRILKAAALDIPFVLCTGSLTEEVAVECMREGASDYVLKTSLKRLPTAVLNALAATDARKAKDNAVSALRDSEEKFRSIVETTNEWIWAGNTDGTITYSNPAVAEIIGYNPDEIIGTCVFDLMHKDDVNPLIDTIERAVTKKSGWTLQTHRFYNTLGEVRYIESSAVPAFNSRSELIGLRGSARDITQRKIAEEQLLHDAMHDGLTGLANRSLFMDHLGLAIERASRDSGFGFAVLFLDFDRFKVINDSLGHSQGDNLLKLIAERLRSSLRPGDLVARLGGDEFTILINGLKGENDISKIVGRFQTDIAMPFDLGGRQVYVTASIGVALSISGYQNPEDMLRDADTAMYRAKAKGSSQYQVFDQSMHEHALKQLQLETEMREAIERQEFCLHYQPIMDLKRNSLVGFEALVRWKHPVRGMVPPMEFIPAAEESGLILPLSKWILQESCKQLVRWQVEYDAAAELVVSVNLSSRQFAQPDLAAEMVSTLKETGLAVRCLKLEITETHLMDNSEAVIVLKQLRELGIDLSIDDFGTGYSSLSYLHRLPVTDLKIDRSFVMRMSESSEHAEIVSTIIKLAHSLKLRSVAEGIETAEQHKQLTDLGCEFGQGYYFARPLEPHAAKELIIQRYEQVLSRVDEPSLELIR